MTPKAEALQGRLLALFEPPPKLKLSEWAEENIRLPVGQSARPGSYRNWPYFSEILDSMADPECERVSIIKGTRLGFTKGLMVAIGAMVATNPSAMILLVPTDDDAKGYATDEVEPIFEASPPLAKLMRKGRNDGRSTLLRKSFAGGASLKILSARAPRKLRRHDAKFLFCDEIDAMEITAEGNPLTIAERRTMAHPDRKLVFGSTPTEEDVSNIERLYAESDQRIYEVPCPHCGSFFEILWHHIRWPENQPEAAYCLCPHCEEAIPETFKRRMVQNGKWRATRPEVVGHRGYRLNALVSFLKNASWGTLAQEFLKAKRGGPAELQPFFNTALALPWRTSIGKLSAESLESRVEPFGLERDDDGKTMIPPWVMLITVGVDVQPDRLEATVLGWPLTGAPSVLGHVTFEGTTVVKDAQAETEKNVWTRLDRWLRTKWEHPNGWQIGVDACAIDSGGSEGTTQIVYDFAAARAHRNIFAIAGRPGPRPVWKRAEKVKNNARLFIVGHDTVKTAVLDALAQELFIDQAGAEVFNPHAIRVSEDLPHDWFEQATGETRRVKYVRNRPVFVFEPKKSGQRVEALDCICYGWAVRQSPAVKAIDLHERASRKPDPETGKAAAPKRLTAAEIAAQLNGN